MLIHGVLLSLIAGLASFVGAYLSHQEIFKNKWKQEELRHAITGFGGGALVSAIALVLIPEGASKQGNLSTLLTFFCGGVCFMFLDQYLAKIGGAFSQFMAMMLDFIPEAIVLGAVVTENYDKALFLTIVIASQNLPEGYSAFLEMNKTKTKRKKLLWMFFLVGLTGPFYIFLGGNLLQGHELILGQMMTFCAGGILYLVFEDIAPKVPMEKHWLPPLGVVLGFMVGLVGYLYVH